jgi:hypothetical protein
VTPSRDGAVDVDVVVVAEDEVEEEGQQHLQ